MKSRRWRDGVLAAFGHPVSRLPPGFFQQLQRLDDHAAIDCFNHIVDGQQTAGAGGQRFHFDAGATESFGSGGAGDCGCRRVEIELDGDARECDRMAERDQVAGAFGGLNGGDAGDAEYIAFLCRTGMDQFKGGRLHANATSGARQPCCFGLGANIDHVGLAGGIEMGER